jgi:protein tyrosine/serine phosphatase
MVNEIKFELKGNVMRNVYVGFRFAILGFCWFLTACATHTQPSAIVSRISSDPAPVFNFQVVSPGGVNGEDAVYRSGQPDKKSSPDSNLDDLDWKYLEKLGIKTVVKLNKLSLVEDEAEELLQANKHGIKVIQIYMNPEDDNWNPWEGPDEKKIMKAVEALESKDNRPVLVHCSHGKDRTGLVVAVYSVRNKNYCKDAALKEMEFFGTSPFLFGLKPMLSSLNIKENTNCTHDWRANIAPFGGL